MVTRNRVQGETLRIACLPANPSIQSVFAIFKGPLGAPVSVDAVVTRSIIGTPWVIGIEGWTDYGLIPPLQSVFAITQDTSAFVPGQWGAEFWAVDFAGNKEVVVKASFGITASIGSGGSNDVRSQAEKAVEMIEAYLADPRNVAAASYKIKDRELARYSIGDLRSLLAYWKQRLREQNIRARGQRGVIGRRINVIL